MMKKLVVYFAPMNPKIEVDSIPRKPFRLRDDWSCETAKKALHPASFD
jgi:hypothetical protein